MIKCYTTIKNELKNRNIYVWDVGVRCIQVFSHLACRGIDVKGFVTNIDAYVGESICARPVISPDAFKTDEMGIIITHDAVSAGTFSLVCGYGEAYRYSDAITINEDLKKEEYYLYGTDFQAWQIINELNDRDMFLKGFLRNGAAPGEQIMGIPVSTPDNIFPDAKELTIISAGDQAASLEMLEALCRSGCEGDIIVREMLPFSNRWGVDPFLMLDLVARNQKKLLLCCEEEIGSRWIHSVLDTYGFEVAKEVCFEGSDQRGVEDIWSLADENPDQSVLLIFALNPARRADIIEAAKDLGFTEENGNYAGIQECCYNREHMVGPLKYEMDKRLPYSLDYSPVGGIPGWAVYGNAEKADKRILVLGGSTSSEVYITENWVSRLYRLCTARGFKTAIYNGAYEGNMVMDELIRLTRGLQSIKPDIVISMSGLNDFRPSLNKFELQPDENKIEYWRRIEFYMKMMTESTGGEFYAFLQPVNTFVRGSADEAIMFTQEGHFNRKASTIDLASSDDFYYNIIDLLQHRRCMFIDSAHYSNLGHEEIAKYVFETIKGALA